MLAVKPVTNEFLPGHAFGLCDLGFVVRENIIDTATMNIDLVAQQRRGHGAALDMPAGPAAPPRTSPADVSIFFIPRLPQREVADVFFVVLVIFHPPGGLQLLQVEMRELPV